MNPTVKQTSILTSLAGLIRRLYAIPLIEGGLVVSNLVGFLIGAIYWYGPQMAVISPLVIAAYFLLITKAPNAKCETQSSEGQQ